MRRGEPPHQGGVLEVICGPMFSGKTEELIRRLRRALIAKQDVVILKPWIDNRFSSDHLVTHNEEKIPSAQASSPEQVRKLAAGADVVGIDEVQFFGPGIVPVIDELADGGARVIVAGLDMDYRAVPFEPVPQLLARAEYITKALAICVCCGNPASRSQRISAATSQILVGALDHYEARCRECFEPPEPDGAEKTTSLAETEASTPLGERS